jgi:NTE family protein
MKFAPKQNSAESREASGAAAHEPTFSSEVKTTNLALQGGGAHGAFTWGVLDRLLDEKTLAF